VERVSTVDVTFVSVADMSCVSVSCVRHVDVRDMELKRSPVAIPGFVDCMQWRSGGQVSVRVVKDDQGKGSS
jgi:hypothetical protein